jgi:hypothetical protein
LSWTRRSRVSTATATEGMCLLLPRERPRMHRAGGQSALPAVQSAQETFQSV